jgi:hypothetical protein
MVLNTQTPHPIYNQQPRTTMQDTSKIRKKTQHAHNHKKKRIQTNHIKTIIIIIFTSKQNKNDQAAQFARQKEQRKP